MAALREQLEKEERIQREIEEWQQQERQKKEDEKAQMKLKL